MEQPDTNQVNEQLADYRRLLQNAKAMHQAASEERWEDLIDMQVLRDQCVAALRRSTTAPIPPLEVDERNNLIRAVLQCDEQTKLLVQSRQQDLSEMLGSMGNERKLTDAYSTDHE
jgi:hypothetical protein